MSSSLINQISWKHVFTYILDDVSLFRRNQDEFVALCGKQAKNSIIEIGSEGQYGYKKYFNIPFTATNYEREDLQRLDVTQMNLESNSVDNFLCISVLEHVFEKDKAALEIHRTLKPGGYLYIVVPFGYPVHDLVDYWRFLPDAYHRLFNNFDVIHQYHLGGKFSTCAEVLKRPRRKVTLKSLPGRLAGWLCILFSKLFEQKDNFPQGYAFILRKK